MIAEASSQLPPSNFYFFKLFIPEFLYSLNYQMAEKAQSDETIQKQMKIDAEEEKKELEDVKAMDSVNDESKAALAGALAGKMQAQKAANKAEAEEAAELKKVAAADSVNEESKAALAKKLAKGPMAAVKQGNIDAAEEKKELADVAAR